MSILAKIRTQLGRSRRLNAILALAFLIAQILPAGLAMAASVSPGDYLVICTLDGFKKVPLSELGLDTLPGDASGADDLAQQDCPICNLLSANGLSSMAPQVAVIWAPLPVQTPAILDDRPSIPVDLASRHDAPPRAPPASA